MWVQPPDSSPGEERGKKLRPCSPPPPPAVTGPRCGTEPRPRRPEPQRRRGAPHAPPPPTVPVPLTCAGAAGGTARLRPPPAPPPPPPPPAPAPPPRPGGRAGALRGGCGEPLGSPGGEGRAEQEPPEPGMLQGQGGRPRPPPHPRGECVCVSTGVGSRGWGDGEAPPSPTERLRNFLAMHRVRRGGCPGPQGGRLDTSPVGVCVGWAGATHKGDSGGWGSYTKPRPQFWKEQRAETLLLSSLAIPRRNRPLELLPGG